MSDISLTQKQKLILKTIRRIEKPTANSIYEDEKIESLMTQGTLRNHLTKLEQQHSLIDSSRPKNCKVYELTPEGSNILERVLKNERMKKTRANKGFTFHDMVDRFVKFYRDYSEDAEKNLAEASLGRGFVELDVRELMRFDAELDEELFSNPKEVFDAAEQAVREFSMIESHKNIRPVNVPDLDLKTISELVAGDIDELVCVQGVIQSVTKRKSDLISAIFECKNCGDRYEKEQEGSKLNTPHRCDCGSRSFECVDKYFETVRILHMKEKPGKTNRASVPVILKGELAEEREKNLDAIGKSIKVYGYVENFKHSKRSEYFDYRLKAKNVEVQKEKWEDLEVTDEDKERFEDLCQEWGEDLPKYVVRSLGHEHVVGNGLLKEALMLFPLTRNDQTRSNTHFLCIGDPGTGKSHLAKIFSKGMPKTLNTVVSSGTTKVGLTGAVIKNEVTNQWEAEAGAISMADGGFHITDEIDKLEEGYSAFNEALSEKEITLNKANIINTKLKADVSEFSIGNPKNRKFNLDEGDLKDQNPIPNADLNSRYAVKFAVARNQPRGSESLDLEQKKAWKIIDRGEEGTKDEDLLSTTDVFKYLTFAQGFEPEVPKKAKEKLVDIYMSLFKSSSDGSLVDPRFLEGLMDLSIAYAKLLLADKVEEEHVCFATDFMKRCYASLDFHIGKNSMDELNDVTGSNRQKIIETVKTVFSEDMVPIEELVEEVDLPESQAENIVESLLHDGELYSPREGFVKVM